jgi:hypothetical protein
MCVVVHLRGRKYFKKNATGNIKTKGKRSSNVL